MLYAKRILLNLFNGVTVLTLHFAPEYAAALFLKGVCLQLYIMRLEKENQNNKAATSECTCNLTAVNHALYAIGGKWKLRIIIALSTGNKRFNEIQQSVNGISPRVLSADLKELELSGLIKRNVIVGYPVIIEYELMPYSHTLQKVFQSLSEWGAEHSSNINRKDVPE